MSFGTVLTELREERGMYQKELATYLKISVGTISNYEKDRHFPDQATLCKIADFFHVSTDYLLGRTRYRYNPELLKHPLTDNYTIADLVNTSLELSPKHKYRLAEYTELLKLKERTMSSGQ